LAINLGSDIGDGEKTAQVCGQQEQSTTAATNFNRETKRILFYFKSSCQNSKKGLWDFPLDLGANQSKKKSYVIEIKKFSS